MSSSIIIYLYLQKNFKNAGENKSKYIVFLCLTKYLSTARQRVFVFSFLEVFLKKNITLLGLSFLV